MAKEFIYSIRAPNGKLYEVRGPENASQRQLVQDLLAKHPEAAQPAAPAAPATPEEHKDKEATFLGSLAKGFLGTASDVRTALGSIFGDEAEAAKAGLARQEELEREYGRSAGLSAILDAYNREGFGGALSSALSGTPKMLAEMYPYASIMGGSALLASGLGAGPGAAMFYSGLSALPLAYAQNTQRQAAEDIKAGRKVEIDSGSALLAGAGSAALDVVGGRFALGKNAVTRLLGKKPNTPISALATEEAEKALARKALEAKAKMSYPGMMARGAASEAPTEVLQQVLERMQAGLPLTTPDAFEEYGEAAYAGAVGGGTLGMLGRVGERNEARMQLGMIPGAVPTAEGAPPQAEAVVLRELPLPKEIEALSPQERIKLLEDAKRGEIPDTPVNRLTLKKLESLVAQDLRKLPGAPELKTQLELEGVELPPGLEDVLAKENKAREAAKAAEIAALTPAQKAVLGPAPEAGSAKPAPKQGAFAFEEPVLEGRVPGVINPDFVVTPQFLGQLGVPFPRVKLPNGEESVDAPRVKRMFERVIGKTLKQIAEEVSKKPGDLKRPGFEGQVLQRLLQPTVAAPQASQPTAVSVPPPAQEELNLGAPATPAPPPKLPTPTEIDTMSLEDLLTLQQALPTMSLPDPGMLPTIEAKLNEAIAKAQEIRQAEEQAAAEEDRKKVVKGQKSFPFMRLSASEREWLEEREKQQPSTPDVQEPASEIEEGSSPQGELAFEPSAPAEPASAPKASALPTPEQIDAMPLEEKLALRASLPDLIIPNPGIRQTLQDKLDESIAADEAALRVQQEAADAEARAEAERAAAEDRKKVVKGQKPFYSMRISATERAWLEERQRRLDEAQAEASQKPASEKETPAPTQGELDFEAPLPPPPSPTTEPSGEAATPAPPPHKERAVPTFKMAGNQTATITAGADGKYTVSVRNDQGEETYRSEPFASAKEARAHVTQLKKQASDAQKAEKAGTKGRSRTKAKGEAAPEEGAGEAAPQPEAGEAATKKRERKPRSTKKATQTEPEAGKAAPEEGAGKAAPEDGAGKAAPEEGAGKAAPEEGAGKAAPEEGAGKAASKESKAETAWVEASKNDQNAPAWKDLISAHKEDWAQAVATPGTDLKGIYSSVKMHHRNNQLTLAREAKKASQAEEEARKAEEAARAAETKLKKQQEIAEVKQRMLEESRRRTENAKTELAKKQAEAAQKDLAAAAALVQQAVVKAQEALTRAKEAAAAKQKMANESRRRLEKTKAALAARPNPSETAKQADANTEGVVTLKQQVDSVLNPSEISSLETYYGSKQGDFEFWTKLEADVVSYVNKGAKAVAAKIRAIVKKVAVAFMAAGLVFNPSINTDYFSFGLKAAYAKTQEIRAEVPANAVARMSSLAKTVYERMAPVAAKSGRGFVIADKPNGMIHVFEADGNLLVQDVALFGKDKGDVLTGMSSLFGGKKVTPAGKFTLKLYKETEYVGGYTLGLVETYDASQGPASGMVAIHAAWLGDPKENRLARLRSPTPEDNRISFGCINTTHDTFLKTFVPKRDRFDGGMVFVLPDNTELAETLFPKNVETTYQNPDTATRDIRRDEDITGRKEETPDIKPQDDIEQVEKPSLREGAAATPKQLKDFEKSLLDTLSRFGLRDVGLKIVKEMQYEGSYAGQLIRIAANAENPMRTLRHEAIHALRDLGFFTDAQWSALTRMAKQQWVDKYLKQRNVSGKPLKAGETSRYDAYMEEYKGDETSIIEEAVADAFSDFDATRTPSGMLSAIANRMKQLFNAIRTALGAAKIESAEDIFRAVEQGGLKRKGEIPPASSAKYSISPAAQTVINAMPAAIQPQATSFINGVLPAPGGLRANLSNWVISARQEIADRDAPVALKLSAKFTNAMHDAQGNVSPELARRQAAAADYLVVQYFRDGTAEFNPKTGTYKTGGTEFDPKTQQYKRVKSPNVVSVEDLLGTHVLGWAKKHNMSFIEGRDHLGGIYEAVRLRGLKRAKAPVVSHLDDAEIAKRTKEFDSDPEIRKIFDIMRKQRHDAIDLMVQSGRITKDMADEWKKYSEYIPFDRESDPDEVEDAFRAARRTRSGLAALGSVERDLVGSKRRPVRNTIENHVNLLQWMLTQSIKTTALTSNLRALEKLGQAEVTKNPDYQSNMVVKTYVNGEMVPYRLKSVSDIPAFMMQESPMGGMLKMAQNFSRLLRAGVTAVPMFGTNQVVQDIQRAALQSGINDVAGATASALNHFARMAGTGLVGKRHLIQDYYGARAIYGDIDYSQPNPLDSLYEDLGLKQRTFLKSSKLGAILHRLESVSRASDLAVRAAVYETTLRETGNEALAEHRAREIINFRRRGANQGILRMAIHTIPFFGSYLQGMDVTLRSMHGADAPSGLARSHARAYMARQMSIYGLMVALYVMAMRDDDEYLNMKQEVRDKKWVLGRIGEGEGIPVSLPVPSEFGVLLKAPIERGMLHIMNLDPMNRTAAEAIKLYFRDTAAELFGRTVPIPQVAKPLFEAWTNISFLTGRNLEGNYQQTLDKLQRTNDQTSEWAKLVAKTAYDATGGAVSVSPIQVDHLLRGYFGTVAAISTGMADMLMEPDRIDKPLNKWAAMGAFTYDPTATQADDEFYAIREKVIQAHNTLNNLQINDPAQAEAYVERNVEKLSAYKTFMHHTQQLSKLRKAIRWMDSPAARAEMPEKERDALREEYKQYARELRGSLMEFIKEAGLREDLRGPN